MKTRSSMIARLRGGIRDAGLIFIFLLVVYVILVIKLVAGVGINNNIFFGIYSLAVLLYIMSRFFLSYFHRSYPVDPQFEPSVTFIVPAKNEGDNVYQTLMRFGAVNYPKEKIEIIAINDGSTDETLSEMYRAEHDLSHLINRIEIVHWEHNRGKRHGMAEGVKRAQNDIVIFIDSDSFVERNCVRHLVKYFPNKEVGAVCGHTEVYNDNTNLLTQMQAVRYYIAFKIYKAAESIFGNVTCCPGCCSAYRRVYLDEFIDEWLHQKFLGKECTFGDDRSLTNFMIRKYKAVYSTEALAYTVVPETFDKYLRQQQRWKKSWIRETFIAAGFIWKKHPLAALSFYIYVFLAFVSPIVFFRAVLWHPLITHELPLVYLSGLLLMLTLHGVYYAFKTRQRWILPIVTFWFFTVILIWQLPWALLTMNDTRWGTR